MCNLSQKEGGSLFAVLAKRQRKTLPKNLHLHVGQLCISFRPMEIQFIRQPRRLNKKCVNWKKNTFGRWRRPREREGGSLASIGETLGSGLRMSLSCAKLPSGNQCSKFPYTSAFPQVPPTGGCLACFPFIQGQDQFCIPIHFKVKCISLPSWAERHQFCGGKKDAAE